MSRTTKVIIYLLFLFLFMLVASVCSAQPSLEAAAKVYAGAGPDYGLIGALALGVLALLAFTVKNDRSDRHRLVDAITQLSRTNDNLANELRQGFINTQQRLDNLDRSIKDLEKKLNG